MYLKINNSVFRHTFVYKLKFLKGKYCKLTRNIKKINLENSEALLKNCYGSFMSIPRKKFLKYNLMLSKT